MRRSASASLLACLLVASCTTSAPELPAGYDREATTVSLESQLTASGFDVARGAFVFFQIADCQGLPSCYGNNPSSPYGLFRVPAAPGEDTSNPAAPLSDASGRTSYRLREDEALLFLGRTPPRSRYFSFTSYVAQRNGVEVFGSVGSPDNHLTLETSGPADDPFDREVALIVTADAALATELRSRLTALGLGAIVNVQMIPSDLANLGLAATDDVMTMLFRVALFDDPVAGQAYVDAPPATLLRIRPTATRTITPAPFAGYRTAGTGTSEADLDPALTRLRTAIVDHYASATVTNTGFIALNLVGSDCIVGGLSCNGDNPDTLYWAIVPRTLAANERIVVYGVDHRSAGKATYTNASVYDYASLAGSVAAHDGQWSGSAAALLGTSDPDAPKLFAWTFARDCGTEPNCTVVPTTFPGVANAAALTIVVRAYLEQATSTAPSLDEVLGPRAVLVTLP